MVVLVTELDLRGKRPKMLMDVLKAPSPGDYKG